MKINHKIFISIVLTAAISVAATQYIQRYNFEQGFLKYTQNNRLERLQPVVERLQLTYLNEGNWKSIEGMPSLLFGQSRQKRFQEHMVADGIGYKSRNGSFYRREILSNLNPIAPRKRKALAEVGLVDQGGGWVAGDKIKKGGLRQAIIVNKKTVGFLVIGPLSTLSDEIDQQFSSQQFSGMLLASMVILVGAGLSAVMLSWHIGGPINRLVANVRSLSAGDYSEKLDLDRKDEIGILAQDINRLMETLDRSRELQRQWITDISHELRTPVTILIGEIECMEDGYQTIGVQSIRSLKGEVKRLGLLIEDLQQLSKSDSGSLTYNFHSLDIGQEILLTLKKYDRQLKESNLSTKIDIPTGQLIEGDSLRLKQLVSNLVENSIRYTNSPGTIFIHGLTRERYYCLSFEDSGPGVPEKSLAKIFNRLYRLDPSRSRATGSSGLGLAICEAIVKAHKGEIIARHSTIGGLAIDIDFPIIRETF